MTLIIPQAGNTGANTSPSSNLSEEDVMNELNSDVYIQKLQAEIATIHAQTEDTKLLTNMKKSYARSVMKFLWMWAIVLSGFLLSYFYYTMSKGDEIPKEVIISMLTCTAVVVGLVGYVIKGLFGNK